MVHDEAFEAFKKAGPLERAATVVFLINSVTKAKKYPASDALAGLKPVWFFAVTSATLHSGPPGQKSPGA